MKRNKMVVVGVLAATFLLFPTGFRADERDSCSECEKRVLGSFFLEVHVVGIPTFNALLTFVPGGGVIETNKAQENTPVTVHGSWKAIEDNQFALTFMTLALRGNGRAKTRETVTLTDSGDSLTAVFETDLMDANGRVFGRLKGTATGKRILVEPLVGSVDE